MSTGTAQDLRDLHQPLAVDQATGTEFCMMKSFGEWDLHFRCPGQSGFRELSIPLSSQKHQELIGAFEASPTKVEIEKKWLVSRDEALQHISEEGVVAYEITQGYAIIGDKAEVRVRSKQRGADEPSYYLTIKGSGDVVRGESEIEISASDFKCIADFCVFDRIVHKTRFLLPDGAELDLYKQAGPQKAEPGQQYLPHATVEREFKSAEEIANVSTPSWYGAEVSKNKNLKNQKLAVHGFPKDIIE